MRLAPNEMDISKYDPLLQIHRWMFPGQEQLGKGHVRLPLSLQTLLLPITFLAPSDASSTAQPLPVWLQVFLSQLLPLDVGLVAGMESHSGGGFRGRDIVSSYVGPWCS